MTVEFPILRKKPSYSKLLETLKDLKLPPTSWNGASKNDSTINTKTISQYLLSIISSDLAWLDKDSEESEFVSNQRDELWELASRRLAERCGRSGEFLHLPAFVSGLTNFFAAMPEMIRTWTVPASTSLPELKFDIREPPLTGDNLGLKTWGTAFAIVKKLEELGRKYFNHLLNLEKNNPAFANTTSGGTNTRVLELGAGTGLVGIAAGAIWGTKVILTDLPEIRENLLFNIQRNTESIEWMGGEILGDVLDWKDPNSMKGYASTEFEV